MNYAYTHNFNMTSESSQDFQIFLQPECKKYNHSLVPVQRKKVYKYKRSASIE